MLSQQDATIAVSLLVLRQKVEVLAELSAFNLSSEGKQMGQDTWHPQTIRQCKQNQAMNKPHHSKAPEESLSNAAGSDKHYERDPKTGALQLVASVLYPRTA